MNTNTMMGYDLLRSPSSEVLRRSSLRLLLLLLFSCTALLLPLSPSARASDDADRLALLAFKSGVSYDPNGWLDSWTNNTVNSSSLHHCQWRGVTCSNSSSRVTILALDSMGLEGVVILGGPRGSLSHLQQLLLWNNDFHGVIPSGIGRRLPSLTYLDLGSNLFEGRIPPSLARCQQLSIIDLSGNKLHGDIPDELGSLSKLEVLNLAWNSLTGSIPPSLLLLGGSNLSSLQQLDLSYNILTQLPPPSELGPQQLSSSSSFSLLYLHLSNNKLVGSVPPYLLDRRFHALDTLDLSYNSLSGAFLPQISNLVNLRYLDLSYNNLGGGIPPSLGSNLTLLSELRLSANSLQGPIPPSLTNLSSLIVLDLSSNKLQGPLPPGLDRLTQLEFLRVSENRLQGSIPESLGSCRNLTSLDLSGNRLSGGIPPSIGSNPTLLYELILSNNMLTGTIPDSLGSNHFMSPSSLHPSILNLSANSLRGPIPSSLTNLSSLTVLDLSSNKLQGPLPPGLDRLTRLEILRVSENRLRGSIPESLGSCLKLNSLDLSANRLSGSIPTQLFGLTSLSNYLNLSNNVLEGPLPTQVSQLWNIRSIDISNNKLSGTIPSTLGDCQLLEYLYLQGNLFQGIIPHSFKILQVLDLSSNSLIGGFPEFLAHVQFLRYLNISFNHLEGPVPTEGIFRNATAISVYGNDKLCGGVPELHLPTCQPLAHDKGTNKKKKNKWPVIISVSLFGVLFFILLFGFLTVRCLRRDSKALLSISPSIDPVHPKVSYTELLKATNDFSSDNLMGFGNCGYVYMGTMNNGEAVAVKVFNLENRGVLKSFMSECEALRNIRHRNLVKILTACSTTDSRGNNFKALVYEFMPNGSLEGWLHPGSHGKIYNAKRLSLTQRVNIAIDVAAALDYLHNQCASTIVHCDLKPSNVLLDDNMTAHVGDFGLSKFLPMAIVATNAIKGAHFSNSVHIRGSIGYIPPEYGMGGSVSTHGDVFSYGMLLLELFTGIRPTDGLVLKDDLTLQKYVEVQLSKGFSHEIADPSLILNKADENIAGGEMEGQYIAVVKQCLLSLFAIALLCVKESPRDRMKIEHVVTQMHQIREGLLLGTK